ncbi:MAG: hypothetical protein ACRDLO_09125 [Solirubrobacterales bacterium]
MIVLIVSLAGSDEDPPSIAADPDCLAAWNQNPSQLSFGVHQYSGHGYSRVQVRRLTSDGSPPQGGEPGRCTVVFAAQALDPAPAAAAQIRDSAQWSALSAFTAIDPQELAELQATAVTEANAILDDQGQLSPL